MTHRSLRARLGAEEGAMLIQVGIALFSLTMFSALVVDYGMGLVSHAQAQNTVDAAALAGATALAFDGFADVTPAGPAAQAVLTVAQHNAVWGEAPAPESMDVDFPLCPDWDKQPKTASGDPIVTCVRVATYRNTDHGNPIATIFASLFKQFWFGVASQAIGEAKTGNATDCLKPLAIPDKWNERAGLPDAFDFFDPLTGNAYVPPDGYEPSTPASAPVYGLTVSGDFGTRVTLTPGDVAGPIGLGSYLPVAIPASHFGNDLRATMTGCAKSLVTFERIDGQLTRLDFAPGDIPTSQQHIAEGAQDLIDKDLDASWNEATGRVDNSCAETTTTCGSMSPRIIPIAVYNPISLAFDIHDGVATGIELTNIVGFFIASADVGAHTITGYITRYPALHDDTAISLHEDASFLRTSQLVQ
jgi:hypothetical protein